MAPLIILPTSGPPLSSRVLNVLIALSLSFLLPICFLIGVTRFFTCEFRCDPTLSLRSFKISSPRSQIYSFPELSAVRSGHTILVKISISFSAECSYSIIYLHTLNAINPYGCFSSIRPSKQVTNSGLYGSSISKAKYYER